MLGNALQWMEHGDDQPSFWGEGSTRDHWAAPNVAYWNQSLGPEWGRGEADPGGMRGTWKP